MRDQTPPSNTKAMLSNLMDTVTGRNAGYAPGKGESTSSDANPAIRYESWSEVTGFDVDDDKQSTKKPYAKSRPPYGKKQIEAVWDANVDPETGMATDPTGANITWDKTVPRMGQWDMGHKPEHKYSDYHGKYMNGEISKEEFLKVHRNPDNYRPELPNTNRGHLFE